MDEIIEMGTISSRGQICIPNNIREEMGLEVGSKIVFLLSNNALIMKRVNTQTWTEITKPLRDAIKKTEIKESEAVDIVHKFRKAKK